MEKEKKTDKICMHIEIDNAGKPRERKLRQEIILNIFLDNFIVVRWFYFGNYLIETETNMAKNVQKSVNESIRKIIVLLIVLT